MNNHQSFEEHKTHLNKVYNLDLETSSLQNELSFLDLTTQIDRQNKCFKFKPCTKPERSLSCLPPKSSSPSGTTKGMARSMLKNKWKHFSDPTDYIKEVHDICQNLINVGHNPEDLKEWFMEASTKIKAKTNNNHEMKTPSMKPRQRIFLHSTFHPKGISRQMMHQTCEEPCGSMFNYLLGTTK